MLPLILHLAVLLLKLFMATHPVILESLSWMMWLYLNRLLGFKIVKL